MNLPYLAKILQPISSNTFQPNKTGFDNLDDEIKTFKLGIYVLSGLPALGKTTFALQLLELSFRRKTNTTFIVISSLNRANYHTEISFESFKETGSIEYSADVIWALQLLLDKRTGNDENNE